MKNKITTFFKRSGVLLAIAAAIFIVGCELRPELPDAGSIPDDNPPSADLDFIPTAEDFRIVSFTNLSSEATNYMWDFGTEGVVCELVDGEMVCGTENTTTAFEPFAKFSAGEGTYTVKLTALDANGASSTVEVMIDVIDEFVPLPVTVINGDFEDSSNNWKISFSNGWNNNGFESSSDGSPNKYDGSDNGGSTRGAKWNATRSVGSLATNGNTRVAYQPVVTSPSSDERDVKYILEFEYAIKDDVANDPPEGRLVIADVVSGHFEDGWEAYQQTDRGGGTSLLHMELSERKGKGNFTVVTGEFTAPESGLVSLMFSAITPVDVYVDNVKVYPAN